MTEPSRAQQSRAEPSRAELSRTVLSRAEPSRSSPAPRRWKPLTGSTSNVSFHTRFIKTDSHLQAAPQKPNDLLLSAVCVYRLPLG